MLADQRMRVWYSATVWSAIADQLKRATARSRPARPMRWRSDASAISRFTAAARLASKRCRVDRRHRVIQAELDGTRTPVSPSTTTSGMPPTALATTGRSQAMASRLMIPNGS